MYNTYILAKMNMILHGFNDAKIERGDTFENPKHLQNGGLMKFDNVMANPPWNLDDWMHSIQTVNGKKKKIEKEDHLIVRVWSSSRNSTDWAGFNICTPV